MSGRPGLQQAIGYQPRNRNRLHTAVLRITGTRATSPLMARVVKPIDAAIHRLFRGSHTATSVLAGLPIITLTTIGAKSGQERSQLLAAIPVGNDLAVIASNFGQQQSPAWVHNLLTNPDASLTYRERKVAVTARLADKAEYEIAFSNGAAINPTFTAYRERVTQREIPVFILTVSDPAGSD